MTTVHPCSADPELWFSPIKADQEKAAGVCQTCPFQAECAQYATDNEIRWGTWGGLTERDRRRPSRKRQKKSDVPASCGTSTAYWRHVNNGQTCDVCETWHASDVEADRRRRLAAEHAKGGSRRGYNIHTRLGEQPCDMCRSVHARDLVERRKRNRPLTRTA